ncbi:O-antigen ligase family protein [Amnibacterium endophyticum]|uniref:O-antigen ligase family protein n=1 Tax=Amnibacterium endophyticum TaxID=2109337 RepID=A0ABW4L9L9_9MICO
MTAPWPASSRILLGLVLAGSASAVALLGAPLLGRGAVLGFAVLGFAAALVVPIRVVPAIGLLVYALVPYRLMPHLLAAGVAPGSVLLVVWAFRRAAAGRRTGAERPRRGLVVRAVLLLLVLVAVLAWILSPLRSQSALWTVNCVLALVAVLSVADLSQEAAVLRRAWPVIGSVVGAYAVLNHLLRSNPVYDAVYALNGEVDKQVWSVYRSTASLGHPILVGLFLACGCVLALGAFARGSRWWLVAVLLTAGGLATTSSRGSFFAVGVAVLVGAVVAVAMSRAVLRRFASVLVVGAGAAAVAVVALPALLERFGSSEAHGSFVQRTRTYDIVFSAWTQHPLLGTGGGTAADAVGDAILSLRYIENWYLQLLLGLGAVGLLVVAALVVALITTAARDRDLPAAMLAVTFCTVIATFDADDHAATLFLLALVVVVVVGGHAQSRPSAEGCSGLDLLRAGPFGQRRSARPAGPAKADVGGAR